MWFDSPTHSNHGEFPVTVSVVGKGGSETGCYSPSSLGYSWLDGQTPDPTRAWLMGWTHQVPPLTVAVIDTNCSCRQHWTPERRNRESDKREWGWRGTPSWRLADSAFLCIRTLFLWHPPFPRATWTGFLPPAPQMPVVLTEKPSVVRITW